MAAREVPVLVKRHRLGDPYVAGGDRAYLIGTQDGGFPDLGWHLSGEMGGLWAHPIKLLDGFWLRIDGQWLPPACAFRQAPFYSEHLFAVGPLRVMRRQWVPDGLPVLAASYRFEVPGDGVGAAPGASELALEWVARTDLRPVWLGERTGMADGPDEGAFDPALGVAVVRDRSSPWWLVAGSDGPADGAVGPEYQGPHPTAGQGTGILLRRAVRVAPGQPVEVRFFIAGSSQNRGEAVAAFKRLQGDWEELWQAKVARYAAIDRGARLSLPDADVAEAYRWVKFGYDHLVRDVPGLGRGLGAGLPDYPWWFGTDSTYSVLGLLPLGRAQHRLAKETLELLASISERESGSGRIIHEASTNGAVFHPGNTQETPHFVKAVYHVYRWTGDREFLRRLYPLCLRGVLEWTLGDQAGPDLLPRGYGIIEIGDFDLKLLDSAVYTYEALEALAELAPEAGAEPAVAERCRQTAGQVKEAIQRRFWLPGEGLYADVLGTPAQMLPRLDRWRRWAVETGQSHAVAYLAELEERARRLPPDEEVGWLLKNWIISTPLEAGLASPEQAAAALGRMAGPEFRGQHGLYLSGLYREQMMTINTGVQAVAEAVYGRAAAAAGWIGQIARTLHLRTPGSPSEMSPDEGCFVQAWTGYALYWPLVVMLGIRPDAFHRVLHLSWPNLPATWQPFAWEEVAIGDSRFSFRLGGGVYEVQMAGPAPWQVVITPSMGCTGVWVDGVFREGRSVDITLVDQSVRLEVQ